MKVFGWRIGRKSLDDRIRELDEELEYGNTPRSIPKLTKEEAHIALKTLDALERWAEGSSRTDVQEE